MARLWSFTPTPPETSNSNSMPFRKFKTDAELHVGLKGGKTAVGPVTTSDGKLEIAAKSGTVEAPTSDVTLIRNDAEEIAHENKLHPGLRHGWEGGINIGFSVARGNSETENLALAFNADHPTEHDKITLYATSINSTNNLATPSTVANLTTGGIRYDRDLNPRLFAFCEPSPSEVIRRMANHDPSVAPSGTFLAVAALNDAR